jgi:nucleotide-binding universal stress UspA family protein
MASTILVAVDFGAASLAALEKARELGAKLNLELVVLHVYSVPFFAYPGAEPLLAPTFAEDLGMAARLAVDKLASSIGGARTVLRCGDAASEILRAIQQERPAMLCMGTHGRSGFAHLMLGSVAEKIVRESPVPVVTVHAPPEPRA